MQNENSFLGSLFKPQRVIPRVRLKFTTWRGHRNKSKEREEVPPYFGVSYKSDDVEAHLLPLQKKSHIGNATPAYQPNKCPQLQTFQKKPTNSQANSYRQRNNEQKSLIFPSNNDDSADFQSGRGSSHNDRLHDKYIKQTTTANWLINEGEENGSEQSFPRRRNTTNIWDAVVPTVITPKTTNQKSGVELLLEVNQYIKDIFMWLDYQKKGYVPYNAIKVLCLLLNKSYPNIDDTCNSFSENDKTCSDKFCKQHLRFEKFSFILRHCFEKEESLLSNLSQRQSTIPVSGVPRRLELLKNIIGSINKLDSYRKFWAFSEDSSARTGLHFDAFKNSNISIISREVELKRRILFQQQEINGLREIIEGLRIALQGSDAENLCLHVRLQLQEKVPTNPPLFYARPDNQNDVDRPAEIQRSYSCESLESGFQTSFESVSKLRQDHDVSNEYSADSDYQNVSKDDDIDYLRRKLRKAYSKIHRANRELESLKFMIIDNKKDKERIKELQNQIEGLKSQMQDRDILLNNSKKECSSLKHSRSRMVTELMKVRSIIAELCFKTKTQEGKYKNDNFESFSMTSLDCGSSTDSLDRYSETCFEKLGCSTSQWNNYKDCSSDSTSTLNLSGKSEDEGEYLISCEAEPRFLPKPPRNPNVHLRNLEYRNVRNSPKTFGNPNNLMGFKYDQETHGDGNASYYKCPTKFESKKILDNLEEEMKLLQHSLDNGKW